MESAHWSTTAQLVRLLGKLGFRVVVDATSSDLNCRKHSDVCAARSSEVSK